MRLIELKSFFLTHFKLFLYAMANPFRLLIFFIWVLTNIVSAQTVFADYKDGCLYVKTQKQLMEMLTQMGPVLQDGKQLLQTFSGMFGGTAANSSGGSGMPFALK